MSWAAHNPEAYDEILKAGIVTKLEKEIVANGFDLEDVSSFTLEALVESLYEAKDSSVYNALLGWSTKEIGEAERDYFSNLGEGL